jgi:hypothetical protein
LSEAAQACFGTPQWAAGKVVPQVSIEFDVADAAAVAAAGGELERAGVSLLPCCTVDRISSSVVDVPIRSSWTDALDRYCRAATHGVEPQPKLHPSSR